MDRFASMSAFIKTVEAGSFSKAAQALGVSPQMVAKHIAFLEGRIGARLLHRTTRRQSLTEIGRQYFERCVTIVADVQAVEELGNLERAAPRGLLRINAPVTFGSSLLAPMVATLLAKHVDVEVDLILDDRMVDPVEDGFDILFRIGDLTDSSFIARKLMPFRLVLCAAPSYLLAHGTPLTPSDLQGHECLRYGASRAQGQREWIFERAGETIAVGLGGRFCANDAKAIMAAALAGFGIALIAESLVREALEEGRLVALLPDCIPPARPMHLLYLPDRQLSPRVRVFIDAALTTFGRRKI